MKESRAGRVTFAFFLFLAAFYLWSYRGISHSPDEWFFLEQAEKILSQGWTSAAEHGFLFSVFLVPFHLLSRLVPTFGAYQASLLLNVVVTAATGAGLVALLIDLDYSVGIALTTGFLYGVGTLAWPYSGYLFREPMAALWLLWGAWALIRFGKRGRWGYALITWGALSASVMTKATTVALVPFFGGYFLYLLARRREPAWLWEKGWGWRKIAGVAISLLILVALLKLFGPVAWRYLRSGRWLPDVRVLVGFFLSPGFGLWWYAPVLFLAFVGLFFFVWQHPAEAAWIEGGTFFYILAATRHGLWWGVWNWGPRQLVTLLPFLALPLATILERWKRSKGFLVLVSAFFALSVGVEALGVAGPFFPYVYHTVFLGGVKETAFVWDWHYFPLIKQWRFLQPEILEPAWIIHHAGSVHIHKTLLLILVALVSLAALFLLYTLREQKTNPRWKTGALAMTFLFVTACAATLHFVYADERYGGDRGFIQAAEALRREGQPGDIVLTDLWGDELYLPKVALMNYCKGQCPPRHDLIRERFIEANPRWKEELAALTADARRVWVVLEGIPEHSPDRFLEEGMEDLGYWVRSFWTGPTVRVILYSKVPDVVLVSKQPQAVWGEAICLDAYTLSGPRPLPLAAGDTLHIRLVWHSLHPIPADLTVSLQLLDGESQLRAQTDRPPRGGLAPTSSWEVNSRIEDRYALPIPHDLPPGTYRLVVILYDPETKARWLLSSGEDAFLLSTLQVE